MDRTGSVSTCSSQVAVVELFIPCPGGTKNNENAPPTVEPSAIDVWASTTDDPIENVTTIAFGVVNAIGSASSMASSTCWCMNWTAIVRRCNQIPELSNMKLELDT